MAEVTAKTAHWFKADERFFLPCRHCSGLGCYTEAKDGKRRKFSHLDFSFEKGDRYIASCPKCRGARRREVTILELRKAYRKLRKRVCAERGFEQAVFDEMVERRLWRTGKKNEPTAWYETAREVAKGFEIEVKGL